MARLITIPFSHFCEKARWALDHAGLPYVEEGHAPILHVPHARRASPRTQVPILVDEAGAFTDSTDILLHLDETLPPARRLLDTPEARDWEDRLDRTLGPATRVIAYHHVLAHAPTVQRLTATGLPAWERSLARRVFPLAAAMIRRAYKVTPENVARSHARMEGLLAEAEAALADGRPFLTGDRFTGADLTLGALLGPVLLPAGYGFPYPPADEAPEALGELARSLANRPIGRFVQRLYDAHRRRA